MQIERNESRTQHIGLAGNMLDFINKKYSWKKISVVNSNNKLFLNIQSVFFENDLLEYPLHKVELTNRYYILTPEKKKIYFTSCNINELALEKSKILDHIESKNFELGTPLVDFMNDQYRWTRIYSQESSKGFFLCIEPNYSYPDSMPFKYPIYEVEKN